MKKRLPYVFACLISLSIDSLHSYAQDWAWMKGDSTISQSGVYGTLGAAAAVNKPGARVETVSWTDASGNLWLFGGVGYPNTGGSTTGCLNDLWKYNLATNQWTWMKGNDIINQLGVYGTKGIAAAGNKPGARTGAESWTDVSGNLWLFGGYGYSNSGSIGYLNDLWKYNTATNQWTWMKGDNTINQFGVYGTLGAAGASNKPGARHSEVTWTDASGNLWLFGGSGYDNSGSNGALNDLWKYNPTTNQWTWMKGDNIINQNGAYGTQGAAANTYKPGARWGSVSWTDASGNLWLFGGFGYDGSGSNGNLNDLWKYNPTTNQWVWMKGDNIINQLGVYGTKGTVASTNKPGARNSAESWADPSGNLWLFEGSGYANSGSGGALNDMWKYNPTTNQWTWMKGDNITDQFGVYGTKGTAASANKPGARSAAESWADVSGNVWLFGGGGYTNSGSQGYLNDLWKLAPCVTPLTPASTTSTANLTICSGNTTTLSVNGVGIQWYATPTSTVVVGASTIYITPTLTTGTYTYYAEANTCTVSVSRAAVVVTVSALPVITAVSNNILICNGQSATLTFSGSATSYSLNSLSSSTTAIVSPTTSTTYTVIGNDVNGCFNFTTITQSVSLCTGINEAAGNELQIFPNPTSGEFTIAFKSVPSNTSIKLYNLLGELVLEENVNTLSANIHINQLANGIYQLAVLADNRIIQNQKIIKQ